MTRDLRWPVFGAFIVAILLYPLLFQSAYAVGAGINIGVMSVATVGFILLVGYARQLAIGQAAFCMMGGYGDALLVTAHGWDPLLAMLVSMLGSMVVAYIIGQSILRLRGYALAMASLAFQLIVGFAAVQMESVTGGAQGVFGIPKFALLGWTLSSDAEFFYFVWLCVALSIAIGLNVDRSQIGRALKAIAASERAANSVGLDIARFKLQMYVLSAGMASVTGSLTVHYLRIMEPGAFGFQYSLNIITAVVAGGLTSIWGGVLGAAIVVGLREALRLTSLPLFEGIIMGTLTVIVLILFPRGVAGGIEWLSQRVLRRNLTSAVPLQREIVSGEIALSLPADSGASESLLKVKSVTRSFGSLIAVDGVDFTVPRHSITALIGPNGAGKTTMFDLISGYQPLNGGEIELDGRRIDQMRAHLIAKSGVGRTFQNLELFDTLTVLENVVTGRSRKAGAGFLATLAHLPQVAREERVLRADAERYLAFVGLSEYRDYLPSALAFGHQRLLEIARALALEPSLLLMDEPASGLNDTETEALADLILRIRAQGITILLVEHDIRLIMGIADHIVVMNYGKKIAEGAPDLVRQDPQVLAAYLGAPA